jgi:membrane protein
MSFSFDSHPRVERAAVVGRALLHEIRTEKLTFMAGSIAYHAFVSLLPLFLLLLFVVAAVGNQGLYDSIVTLVGAVLTEGARDEFITELNAASRSRSLSVFGVLVLVWGTLRIFRGLDTAFSDIYESEAANTFTDQLTDGVLVLVTFVLAVVVATAVGDVVETLTGGSLGWVLGRVLLILGLAAAFYPMYYVFPDTDVGYLEVLPGTLVAAVGLTVFESLFRVYVSFSSQAAESSAIAGILVFLTWLYFSGLVILLGAAVNAVLSNRSRDVNVSPVLGGVALDAGRESFSRADVVPQLERLDRLLDGRDDVVVTVGEDTVTLVAPDEVLVDTQSSRLLPGGAVSVELRWSPADE